jgi:hypothetical protein
MHFDPSKSPFINLFDIQNAEPSQHFLKLAILHYLSKIPPDGATKGYMQLSDLVKYLATLGYSFNTSVSTTEVMIEKHYVRKPVIYDSKLNESDKIRITSLGRYHIYSLITLFQYLDATIIDTPIIDESIRAEIDDVTNISARLKRTELFLKYLDDSANYVQDKEIRAVWEKISSDAKENLLEIKNRIKI